MIPDSFTLALKYEWQENGLTMRVVDAVEEVQADSLSEAAQQYQAEHQNELSQPNELFKVVEIREIEHDHQVQ